MSGGSYDYLYSKSSEDLIFNSEKLDSMIARLIELDLLDISQDSLMIKSDLYNIKLLLSQIQDKIDKLSPVWKAVEWFDSSDYGISEVLDSVEKYTKYNKKHYSNEDYKNAALIGLDLDDCNDYQRYMHLCEDDKK